MKAGWEAKPFEDCIKKVTYTSKIQRKDFLPKGTYLKPDASLENYERTDSDYFEWVANSNDPIYRVGSNKIDCTNCPLNYNDDDDDENYEGLNIHNPNVTINKEGISIKNDTTTSDSKEFKELKINKDGIIIKTN